MVKASMPVVAALIATAMACGETTGRGLAGDVESIRAIDNHTHVVAPDTEHDTGYDALPCDALPAGPTPPPANLRFGPDVLNAWQTLYGFSGTSGDEAQVRAAHERQMAVRQRQGTRFFEWVLDQAGIDVALANRITMAPQLAPPRFLWVPYDDALLFPLDNARAKAETPDRKVFYEREEQILKDYFRQDGEASIPRSLDDYLAFVVGTLARQKSGGAVAIKFEVAYLRSLDFAPADREAAASVYGRYRAGGVPGAADYKALQDFLFRHIAAEAGRIGLVVQIHTGTGCGEYFDVRGAQPLLLESVLDDPALRQTTFVLLHGGLPVERTLASLITKPKVYVDVSALELEWSVPELARVLRPWLEMMPEHVLFGTDAGPWGPGMGWEESTWVGSRKVRRALAGALTDMVGEQVITLSRAREIANRVLRENAAELYRLKSSLKPVS